MPDADLMERLYNAAVKLCNESMTGFVEGRDVAVEAGEDPEDPGAKLYWALQELERRGRLDCNRSWPGGMGLPSMIRLP